MKINEPRQTLCDTYGEPRRASRGGWRPPLDPGHVALVHAWFAAWRALTATQKARWHAMPKDERESSKQLSAEAFTALMTR